MSDSRLRVVLGWHMHQPEYRDPVTGEYLLPWTCLHAIKDYGDMAAHLEAEENARAVINFAPLLLEQISDYAAQIAAHFDQRQALKDPSLAALAAERYPSGAPARQALIDAALRAHPDRLIGHYPAYRRLAEQAERMRGQPDAVAAVPDSYIADLVTWFHLAWMGETVKRSNDIVQVLLAQERGYNLQQRQELLRLIGVLVAGIIPRYRALATAGKIELSLTPYGHPIVPLLLDFSTALDAQPDAALPPEGGYPGGAERAHWHFDHAIQSFENYFGLKPRGCWCSEGGVSEDTLKLVAGKGFSWTATGQTVLGNSAGPQAMLERPYRLAQVPLDCFFRDDDLSDRIGFRYSGWHGDDAVADLVHALEQRAQHLPAGSIVTLFLDGENAWEHYPANGYYFLSALYRTLSNHPKLRLTTFSAALDEGASPGVLDHMTAGSWVYGTFSTWIGSADKNRGWSRLIEAKQAFDRAQLEGPRRQAAQRQLAICEGSDWFWWLGDENPARAVSDFESLFRLQLMRLYELLGVPAPPHLREALSHGRGSPLLGGVMKTGSPESARQQADPAPAGTSAGSAPLDTAGISALHPSLFQRRRAGILLHPTSLPNTLGSGDLSHDAYRFVEFLAAGGFSVWQVLPIGPTHKERSPYLSPSANAGNPLLISLDWLMDRGWLTGHDQDLPREQGERHRRDCLQRAHAGFCAKADSEWRERFRVFSSAHADWLADYSLFAALREVHGDHWTDWPTRLRDRENTAMDQARKTLAGAVDRHAFEQFVFRAQWQELRAYAHARGVSLFGDLPLFVAHNSADVWAHRELFSVDAAGTLEKIAGVPPDYYAEDGQIWGNPLYRWEAHRREGFAWWVRRLRNQLAMYDLIRIDHFRGLEAHWELPASAQTAREGRWVAAPGAELLKTLHEQLHPLPLVAEDLGEITDAVHHLREQFGLPGMRVLQFGFDGSPANIHLPQNYSPLTVAYTGTHDNATTLDWFGSLDSHTRELVNFRCRHATDPMPWPMIHEVLGSVARLALLPLQDLLGIGAEGRMNTPGTSAGNWNWQFRWDQLPPELGSRLRRLNEMYARG